MNTSMSAPGGASPLGVSLDPSERVLWFDKPTYRGDKIVFAVFGLLTLVIVIGVGFLVAAYFWERWQPRGTVVTNRRVIAVDRHGVATSTALADVASLDAERARSNAGGGGIVGALLSVAVDAIATTVAERNAKLDAAWWRHTAAVALVLRDGARVLVPTRRAQELGPFLVRLCDDPASADRLPTVPTDGAGG